MKKQTTKRSKPKPVTLYRAIQIIEVVGSKKEIAALIRERGHARMLWKHLSPGPCRARELVLCMEPLKD